MATHISTSLVKEMYQMYEHFILIKWVYNNYTFLYRFLILLQSIFALEVL